MASEERRLKNESRAAIIKALTSRMLHKHYCENDVEALIECFDNQMIWLGAGEKEFASGSKQVAEIFRQFAGQVPPCQLDREEYEVIEIDPEVSLCSGRLWITTDPSTHIYLRVHQRFSLLFHWEGDTPRCCHIHISNPYGEMEEDDVGFPTHMGQQSYQYLLEQVSAQSAQIEAQAAELESIYHTIPCGIMRLLRTSRGYELLTFNQALVNLTGYSQEELYNLDWSRGYCGQLVLDDRLKLQASLASLSRPGEQISVDYRITNRAGQHIYLSCTNSLISQEEEGAVIQRFIFDISRRVDLESRLKRLSYEDSLTGLFNRNMFNLIIDGGVGHTARLGVACLDLNGLKVTNDRLGHSAGDELIRRTAKHIRQRFQGRAYRIGGDEFVIIDEGAPEGVFRAAVARLCQAMEYDGISVSMGLSWRDHHCSVKAQFDEADSLMYQFKKNFYNQQQLAGSP